MTIPILVLLCIIKDQEGGNDFNDFVIYARAGRDLVLKSDKSGGNVYIGASYNLKSLNEVDNFIQANGHLPGMPSAQEVIQNGMNLKEIQLKLVEKVEELTLHMIELKKENEKLKRQINQ